MEQLTEAKYFVTIQVFQKGTTILDKTIKKSFI